MFEQSLIESEKKIKTHRGATTLLSFLIQVAIVALLVLLPLVFTQALPTRQLMTTLVAPPPPPPPPPPPAAKVAPRVQPQTSKAIETNFTMPTKIPQKIAMIKDQPVPAAAAAPPVGGVVGGVPGGVAGGQVGGVLGGVLGSVANAVPKMQVPNKIRVSQGVSQGLLEHKVSPVYPPAARQQHIQGTVVLEADISKSGKVENVKVVSGRPVLAAAAVNAVKQWRYKPYYLNGQPVSVETTVTVNFQMNAG